MSNPEQPSDNTEIQEVTVKLDFASVEPDLDPAAENTSTEENPKSELDKLVNVVLETAGVANRSSEMAASATENLLAVTEELAQTTAQAKMNSVIILSLVSLLLLLTSGALIWSFIKLEGSATRTEGTLLAVGKRMVEMNAGTESLKNIESLLTGIDAKKESGRIESMEKKLDTALVEIRKPAEPVSNEKASKEDQARHQALLTQIKVLDGQNQAQARATAKLGDQLNTSRAELSKLSEATRKLETTLNAERQRPAAIAPSVAVIRPREKPVEQKDKDFVQFPAPQAQKTETAKPNR